MTVTKRHRWMAAASMAFACGVWIFPGHADAARRTMVIGTAPLGSGHFAHGVGMAVIVNKLVPELALTPQEAGGSVAAIQLLDAGKFQIIGISPMVGVDAAEGKPPFKKKIESRLLFNKYRHGYIWFARKASGITSWDQVVGKKAAIGTPGGNTRLVGDLVVNAKGLVGKSRFLYLRPQAMIDALRDGTIDAGYGIFEGVSVAPWVQEVVTTLDVNLYGLDAKTIDELAKSRPGLLRVDYPQDFVQGRPGFATIGDNLVAAVSPKLEERIAYLITKAILDNLGELATYTPAVRGMKLEDAIKGNPSSLSYHPGAIRYYREKGLMK